MPSTYTSLRYHFVYSTKHREKTIAKEWRSRLHEYLGGTIRGLGGIPMQVGGVDDHVHLLVGLKPTHCVADVLRDSKKIACDWVHDEIGLRSFYWQEGYSGFTVSPTACDGVRRYIQTQEEHHRTKTFREELIELLANAGIEYDPKYLD